MTKTIFALICATFAIGSSTLAGAEPLADGNYRGTLYDYSLSTDSFNFQTGVDTPIIVSSCTQNCGEVFISLSTIQPVYFNQQPIILASLSSTGSAFDEYTTGRGGGDDSLYVSDTRWDHFINGLNYQGMIYPDAHFIADYSLGPEGAVPEPSTWAMTVLGFGGLGSIFAYRKKTRSGDSAMQMITA